MTLKKTTIKFLTNMKLFLENHAKAILIVAFLLMMISRFLFIVYEGNDYQPYADENKYISYASHLKAEGKFIDDGGKRAWAPPGYPAVLSLSFLFFGEKNLAMARLQQLVFDAITFWLIYLLGYTIGGVACGVLGSLGFLVHPENILILGKSTLLTENLFVLMFILFLLIFIFRLKYVGKYKTILTIVTGLVAGLGMLVRPLFIGLPLIIIILWLLTKIFSHQILSLKDILILIATFSVIPGLWMARNYYVLNGYAVMTSHSGLILYSATNPDIDGRYTPGKILARQIIKLTPETEGRYAKELTALGLRNIIEYKWRWALLAFKNIGRLWVNLPNKLLSSTRWLYAAYIPIFLFLLFFGGISIWKGMNTPQGFTMGVFVVLLFIYYSGLHSVANSSIRYSVPFLPILMIYAAAGLLSYVESE